MRRQNLRAQSHTRREMVNCRQSWNSWSMESGRITSITGRCYCQLSRLPRLMETP